MNPSMNQPEEVKKYMVSLSHKLKREVEELRKIIRNMDAGLEEQIKWNAPSFSYHGEYMVTFNLSKKDRILLVFHHPKTPEVKSKILEGDYKDGRRLTYFFDMNDVKTKKKELEYVIKNLVKLTDNK